jgi:zinc and cadmium transporter
MVYLYVLLSVLFVSLVSVIVAIPFLIKKKISNKTLLFLLSLSIGVLLSTVFINLIPEAFEIKHEYDTNHEHKHHAHDFAFFKIPLIIISGFLLMFIIEKFVHHHHNKKCEKTYGHSHAYNLAPINLIGDGIHNFIDGLLIAASYMVDIVLGITVTISVLFHEIPQEIADFGILLYSGFSKLKAILFNFLSALTAVIGAIIGLLLVGNIEGLNEIFIPFAIGNFLYIAASNLVPQLHRHCGIKDSLIHIFAIILGIIIIIIVNIYGPAHIH